MIIGIKILYYSNSISEIITENSYKNINSFIHQKAEHSKYKDKIVNYIKIIMENSRKYFYTGTYITIDKRTISFIGRAESIKWGFKPFTLADLITDFTYCFKLLNDNEIDENYKNDKMGKCLIWLLNF